MSRGSVHIITDTDRRGAQVFAADLTAALIGLGTPGRMVALERGVDATGLDVPALGPSRLAPRTLLGLRRAVRHASVVVGHGSTTLPACVIAGRGLEVPFVYRNIGDPLHWARSSLQRAWVSMFLGRAVAVVALCEAFAEVLMERFGVRPTRLRVIPNGVAAERFPPIDPAARVAARADMGLASDVAVVAYLGALTPEKDVGTAIRAVQSLDGAMLLIAGDGPQRPQLEAMSDLGRVRFVGRVPDPARVLAAADAVVLSSRSEGMPAVLVEAGLSGLPTVATRVGAVAEVIDDGRTGLLVPIADHRAMRDALSRAIDSGHQMGQAARVRCLERFELGPVSRSWNDLLAEVASASPTR